MKHLFKSLSLMAFIGCGSDHSGAAVSPAATPSPSPTPVAFKCDSPFLGSWQDLKLNQIIFTNDCGVLLNNQKFIWALEDRLITFSSNASVIDNCIYQIVSNGTLTTSITTILTLVCDKSGILTYIKQ